VRIAILHDALPSGARPDEADVLVQAGVVQGALAESGHESWLVPVGLDLAGLGRVLGERRPDLIFNLVESLAGDGRLIHLVPSFLGSLGLRYTGCSASALYLSSHKLLAKRILAAEGLPTPEAFPDPRIPGAAPPGRGRWIVKAVFEDASIGLDDASVLDAADPGAVARALVARQEAFGSEFFAERYVEGREILVALLTKGAEVEVLGPAEIRFEGWPASKPRIVSYAAKWEAGCPEYARTHPRFDFPRRDRPLLEALGHLARRCASAFGLSGSARVDFRVDEAGRPWILEVNPNPCLSPDAGFLGAAARVGLTPRAVVDRIVDAALGRGR
jgi:D-alanine-D-alanine ligase